MDFNEKVAALRAAMEKEGADVFMVTTEDAYLAESACDYWRSRSPATPGHWLMRWSRVTSSRSSRTPGTLPPCATS